MTILDDLTPEEIQIVLELMGEATSVGEETEVEVHQTKKCLLCGEITNSIFMAREVTQVSKLGDVKHTRLVSDNGDKPAFEHFEYTTYTTTCKVCAPRLRRLSKGQLVMLAIKLSKLTMFEAQRRGIVDYCPAEEVIRK